MQIPVKQEERLRVAADIGGTFTDIVVAGESDVYHTTKVPSTPEDFSQGVVDGIQRVLSDTNSTAQAIDIVVHATTVATNAILEGKGAATALVTTKGFRDVLEFRRLRVPRLYDIMWVPPKPLVRRRHRFEISERIDSEGNVLTPIDRDELVELAKRIANSGIESIAICLINSYANPVHEQEIAEVFSEVIPQVPLSLSTDIQRELKEYERTSTTVVNAYVKPLMQEYLEQLARRLQDIDADAPIFIMQSSGSMVTTKKAAEQPARIVESGPAAGVVGAKGLSEVTGEKDLVTFDMGGTTAKAALIENGEITMTPEHGVGGGLSSGANTLTGGSTGYVVRLPAVDLAEVGAGGGSIVWIDEGGGLQVGPASAGAVPGPACYGLGGTAPTITDCNAVLGYLPAGPLGDGSVILDPEKAAEAVRRVIAEPLGMELEEAAYGVHLLANAAMTRAISAVSTERGRDVRGYTLVAFGGSGPVHAAGMARDLDISKVLVPPAAGVFSAYGLLFGEVGQEAIQTVILPLNEASLVELKEAIDQSKSSVISELTAQGYAEESVRYDLRLDMQYEGQSHLIGVATPSLTIEAGDLDEIAEAFGREHEQTYGHRNEGSPVQVVNVRLRGRVERDKAGTGRHAGAIDKVRGGEEETRMAYFGPEAGWQKTRCLTRAQLPADSGVAGPLVIQDSECTIVIPPGSVATIDDLLNVVIDVSQGKVGAPL